MKVLNVGGNNKNIRLPELYDGWEQIMLDIDPNTEPDIVADARDLSKVKEKFFSIYASHVLEHFYPHDVPKVLKNFKKVLDKNGFVYIIVPDVLEVMKKTLDENIELDGTLYRSGLGPISPLDVFYGYHVEIEESGQDWFAHKIGYSPTLIRKYLNNAGFKYVHILKTNLELRVIASNYLKENPFNV